MHPLARPRTCKHNVGIWLVDEMVKKNGYQGVSSRKPRRSIVVVVREVVDDTGHGMQRSVVNNRQLESLGLPKRELGILRLSMSLEKAFLRTGTSSVRGASCFIGPTMPSSPRIGNLPSPLISCTTGIGSVVAGSAGAGGRASSLVFAALTAVKSLFLLHCALISAHFCSVSL